MKKRTTFLTTINRALVALIMIPALAICIGACSDDDDTTPTDLNEIKDLPGSVNVTDNQAENTAALTFKAASSWTAAYADEDSKWFTFAPESGNAGDVTITITAPYNDSAANTGKLTIKHGTATYTVTINQKAGKPDVAAWEKDGLLQTLFAPDPYNATADRPATYAINVTTTQDYATLDKAPFEIMTFYADDRGTPTDSLIYWVKVNIADGSPAAKDGKKLEVVVDTIAVDLNPSKLVNSMQKRFTYFCIVPRGTNKADMFNGKEMKDEYKAMGTSIEQDGYRISYPMGTGMIMTVPPDNGSNPSTSGTIQVTANCKYGLAPGMGVPDSHPNLEWWSYSVNTEGTELTITIDFTKPRATTPPTTMCSANQVLCIDRGPNMKAIPLMGNRVPTPIMIVYTRDQTWL